MKKFSNYICKNKIKIIIIFAILLIPAFICMEHTKINYDILVYLPEDIETVKGENVLTKDFNMGSFSIIEINNMSPKDILIVEEKIKKVDGIANAASLYDAIGTNIPIEMLPQEIVDKVHQDKSDLLIITFSDSTSSEDTLNAVDSVKKIMSSSAKVSGMSAMVLDTMNLSNKEITIYVIIAVILCIIVLQISLDSYLVPILLLANIGIAILFNMGSNIILGNISYITKALAAVLQLGITTDFSIFLYHSYETKKKEYKNKEEAMSNAIQETFVAIIGSSLTTIVGFLALCAMNLTLGKDLGIVMAKGVLIGVLCVITIFPSLILTCDKVIEKTRHKKILPNFNILNNFIIKNHKLIFIVFLLLIIPFYKAYNNVSIYYKLDKSLPDTLDSIVANNDIKEKFNLVSPEIILIDKNLKEDNINKIVEEIKKLDGIDLVLSTKELKDLGITNNMLSSDVTKLLYSDKYQIIILNSTYDIATDELNNQVEQINKIIKKYDKNSILAGEGPLMNDLIKTSDTDFNNVNTYSIISIFILMLILLKSISLPVLLIITIEFAIFLNMGISYFNGATLPFVAPIVLGTIQLGATIDYAILMTTTYMGKRKLGLDKQTSMQETLNNCVESIIISGACFFAATFGVGIYSKLEMVGSLCTLISRGAIISMLTVILILPSILLIFDQIITKTTFHSKGENNMKKIIKKSLAIFLIALITLSDAQVLALTKSETVYGTLNSNGDINNIIVNEHIINNEKLSTVEDNSELKNILNINNNDEFYQNENKLTWNTTGNDIFYQGTTNKQLPVSLKVTYMLDNKEMSITDMIGKKGHVTINLKYTNTDIHYVNGLKLYTPFVVTMGTIINSNNNTNINVTNGKIVNTGNKNIIVGISSPGLYESLYLQELKNIDTITINYDTNNFELSSIYSVITTKLLDNSDLQVFNKLDSLYSGVSSLETSMQEITDGVNKIQDGTTKLATGTNTISDKLQLVTEKLSEIEQGIIGVDAGITQIITKLTEISTTLNSSDNTSIEQVERLIQGNTLTINKLTTANNTIENIYIENNLNEYTEEQLAQINQDLFTVKKTYESNLELITLLTNNNNALTSLLNKLNGVNQNVTNLITTLQTELGKIKIGTTKLASGSTELRKSVELLTTKSQELSSGMNALDTNLSKLTLGVNSFNEEGIKKLSKEINNNVKSTTYKLKQLTNLANNYTSLTTNGMQGDTKFILVINSIKNNQNNTIKEEKTTKTTFFQRIINLFK